MIYLDTYPYVLHTNKSKIILPGEDNLCRIISEKKITYKERKSVKKNVPIVMEKLKNITRGSGYTLDELKKIAKELGINSVSISPKKEIVKKIILKLEKV